MKLFPEEILKSISEAKRIVIATHISPDPDAIGSSTALCLALKTIAKECVMYVPEEFPERLSSFASLNDITNSLPEAGYLLVGLDCATKKRLGDYSEELCSRATKVINIDHHGSNEGWGDIDFIIADASATAAMVYELLVQMKVDITPRIASALYAGIMDDTGSFRFSNTTDSSLLIASKLVSLGAKPSEIANAVYFQEPLRAIKLKSKTIDTIKILNNGKFALAYLSLAMRGDEQHSPGDSEGLIDVLRAIKGVEVALFLREKEPGEWRGSMRTKSSTFDASAYAEKFGGGGHKAAAGFSISGSVEEVLSLVEKEYTSAHKDAQ